MLKNVIRNSSLILALATSPEASLPHYSEPIENHESAETRTISANSDPGSNGLEDISTTSLVIGGGALIAFLIACAKSDEQKDKED